MVKICPILIGRDAIIRVCPTLSASSSERTTPGENSLPGPLRSTTPQRMRGLRLNALLNHHVTRPQDRALFDFLRDRYPD
jgi:hypothetical protein